jgi:hypothetical protein
MCDDDACEPSFCGGSKIRTAMMVFAVDAAGAPDFHNEVVDDMTAIDFEREVGKPVRT